MRGLIQLAASLGLGTVAEGVETPDLARWLAEHSCRLAQGYFTGRPAPL